MQRNVTVGLFPSTQTHPILRAVWSFALDFEPWRNHNKHKLDISLYKHENTLLQGELTMFAHLVDKY